MDDLKQSITRRAYAKGNLTKFKNFFDANKDTVDVDSLEKRLRMNERIYTQFDEVQTSIEMSVMGTEHEATHSKERDQFETTYFDLIAAVERHITNARRSSENTVTSPPQGDLSLHQASMRADMPLTPRLPTITLPHFDGDYSHWIRFRDTFQSLIHFNESLSNIQKFHYLSCALQGSAARVIQSFGVTESNYLLAWATLKRRFEDGKDLKYHHLHGLLDLEPIRKVSHTTLRDFEDNANNHLSALANLMNPVERWDGLVTLILSRKLDSHNLREWEKSVVSASKNPTPRDLMDFIEGQARCLERTSRTSQSTASFPNHARNFEIRGKPQKLTTHLVSTVPTCTICKENHYLAQCEQLRAMSHDEKHEAIKRLNACFNCLSTGHSIKTCTRGNCRKCGKRHHTLLHRDTPVQSKNTISGPSTSLVNSLSASVPNSQTILSTAIVYLQDIHGKRHQCRALLDAGSQAHFITEEMLSKLQLPIRKSSLLISGIGNQTSPVQSFTQVNLLSRCNSFRDTISCCVIKQITEHLPRNALDTHELHVPSRDLLADPTFNQPGNIDLLIGAGLFWKILCVGQKKAGYGDLLWQKTSLGWVLAGEIRTKLRNSLTSVVCNLVRQDKLDESLQRFWEIEEIPFPRVRGAQHPVEEFFQKTITRHSTGRYEVAIPFKDNKGDLGESFTQALKRLQSIERRFDREPILAKDYKKFMAEYIDLGHMTKVIDNSVTHCFLPHHAVLKTDSTTTKLRVVFDGSAKSSSGISLNDTQIVGPTVQSELFSILLRFRTHRFVVSADIKMMYRQILVRKEDRSYQRILWRTSPQQPVETFELNTVTYGTASAPYLATRVLNQVALDALPESSLTRRVILEDFYVDDLLTGSDNLKELNLLKHELETTLSKSGFDLRKWASNDYRVSNPDDQVVTLNSADKNPKTLGIFWHVDDDTLRYAISLKGNPRITKRIVLSEIAQIFDPLGLVGPIITAAKLLMQTLWQLKLDWDESLPQALHVQWEEFRAELDSLKTISIPRHTICSQADTLELHGFADASEKAYGACLYIKSFQNTNLVNCSLLCAKSRVAPLKQVTLPRLELCAAVLLSQLLENATLNLRKEFRKTYLWTDSTIVLAWLNGSPDRWKPFVANRVNLIQHLTKNCVWQHVSSNDNPADLISRGCSPAALHLSSIWWSGPSWLPLNSSEWPSCQTQEDHLPEERNSQLAHVVTHQPTIQCEFINKFSSYSKLLRVFAYVQRFITRTILRAKIKTNLTHIAPQEFSDQVFQTHCISAQELSYAESLIIKLVQLETFPMEYRAIQSKAPLPKHSRLVSLNPILDSRGLIRVGGRLVNSSIPYDHRHPMILPAKHFLTQIIVEAEHRRLFHAGAHQTLASLRCKFWPLSGRNLIRNIIHRCVICFKVNPTSTGYLMGNLPAARVTPARPFSTCGVDYAGPFLIKEKGRFRTAHKAYTCIFVCFATKATHIELAIDLSTNAFVNCLRRFISRRGKPTVVWSDNGSNFIGARNELGELGALLSGSDYQSHIVNAALQDRIQWNFIPPHSPHFGGLWEGAVKSMKAHLKRVIGDQRLTYEEFYTILTQVEACLNSRPLFPLSHDPEDLTPLTPAHFLIGDSLVAYPQPHLGDLQINRLDRYQLVQRVIQDFWKRWQTEYLHTLQQRSKWRTPSPSILKDALVIIKEDNLLPLHWPMGRIMELHPGTDNTIRVVTVRTSTGTVCRPVTKICVLPIPPSSDTSSSDM